MTDELIQQEHSNNKYVLAFSYSCSCAIEAELQLFFVDNQLVFFFPWWDKDLDLDLFSWVFGWWLNFVTTYKITLNVCLDFLQAWLWWFDFLHAYHDLFACNSIEVLTCSSPLLMHDFVFLHDVHSFSMVPTWITLSSISMRMTISIGIHGCGEVASCHKIGK